MILRRAEYREYTAAAKRAVRYARKWPAFSNLPPEEKVLILVASPRTARKVFQVARAPGGVPSKAPSRAPMTDMTAAVLSMCSLMFVPQPTLVVKDSALGNRVQQALVVLVIMLEKGRHLLPQVLLFLSPQH